MITTDSPGRTIAVSNDSQSRNSGACRRRVRTSYAVPVPALCAVALNRVTPSFLSPDSYGVWASPTITHRTEVRSHHRNPMVTSADTNAAMTAAAIPLFSHPMPRSVSGIGGAS